MSIGLILVVLLIVVLLGAVPYSQAQGWGYGPPGIVGLILVVLLILILLGKV